MFFHKIPNILCLCLLLLLFNLIQSTPGPDEFLTPKKYIESRGYIAQIHHIITRDGYILQAHRIISPKFVTANRKAVIIQHGLLLSSMVFITNSPGGGLVGQETFNYDVYHKDKHNLIGGNLGFLLADLGYDVWMPNSRGNTYGCNHTKLDPFSDRKFWEFSFEQMALIDLPDSIEYIRQKSGQKEIAYIGHSQGTLTAFTLLSLFPIYSQILRPLIMLAPIVDMRSISDELRLLIGDKELMGDLAKIGGPIFPHASLLNLLPEVVCSTKIHYICANVVGLMGGLNLAQMNTSRLPVYFSYVPAGTSTKNIVHYHQAMENGTRRFDYGKFENRKLYGTLKPPFIPFWNINSRYVAIFYSESDLFSGQEDLDNSKKLLTVPLYFEYKVPDHLWSHMDFVWGKQVGPLVYYHVVEILKRFPIVWSKRK